MTDVSVLIVNWNTRDLLLRCLDSVQGSVKGFDAQVVVVDNGSHDGSADAVAAAHPSVVLIRNDRNLGYGAAMNLALERALGRVVLFFNSDAELTAPALRGLVGFLDETPDAAGATPQLVHPDGSAQNSFDTFPALAPELLNKTLLRLLLPGRYPSKRQEVEAPTPVDAPIGASLAVKKAVLDQVGHFDERFFFFLEETDLCLRMTQAGFRFYLLPQVTVVHGKGVTKAQRPARGWIEYYRSNYAYFRKHRSPAAYLLLRVGKLVKLPANLLLTALATGCTLGFHSRSRRKLRTYAALVWWHLRLCPARSGLQDA